MPQKRHPFTLWMLVILLAFPVSPALAQGAAPAADAGDDMTEVRRELEALRQRLAELEERLTETSEDADMMPEAEDAMADAMSDASAEDEEMLDDDYAMADDDDSMEARPWDRTSAFFPSRGWLEGMHYGIAGMIVGVHAFIDLEYIDAGPDGSRNGNSTFDNHHANIFVEAEIRPNLTAHAEFEFEHGGDVVEVDQAFMAWAVNDALTLEVGRYYAPFGIERFVHYSPTNLLVSRPEPMRQIIPGNFYSNGVMLAGVLGEADSQQFSYEVSVSNGLGNEAAVNRRGSRQTRDNNNDKAVTGRFAWIPTSNLEIGTSYHTQRYDDAGDLDFTAYGLDIASRWQGWQFRGEYLDAELERSGVADLGQDGWYAQLGYTFTSLRERFPDVTLVSRLDEVNLNDAITGNDDQRLWSLGVNTSIYDHFRFKLEYRMVDEDGPDQDDDIWYTQFVVDF